MIFFDSESKVNTTLSDEEIQRAADHEEVRKDHHPYLIRATFRHKTNKGNIKKEGRSYYPPIIPISGEETAAGADPDFLNTFWREVDSFARVGERLLIFAHNAKYDVQVTGAVSRLIKMGYTVTGFSDSNPFILTFVREITISPKGKEYKEPKRKTIILLSSTNYFQQSLKKLGEVFDLPKLDFDHDEPFTFEKADVYCARDVEILETAMISFIDFIEREQLGSLMFTVAGQAFAGYRSRFLDDPIYIHSDEAALKIEREAYAGGRTECFAMGGIPGNTKYVDVNSMYPYVMKHKLYPVKLLTRWKRATVHEVKDAIMDDHLVIAQCRIKTSEPMFHKKDARLIFPVGDYWTTLCTPEIIKGLDAGVIVEVKQVCLYEPGNIFESYVDYFYLKRLEAKHAGDEVHSYLFKIFLNSLYGKFGQRNHHWEIVADADPEEIDTYTEWDADSKERILYKVFGGHVWAKHDDPDDLEAFNSFPGIAAHVTAYARMLLWGYIEVAGRENVYYSDTDSLFTNETGYKRLEAAGLLNPDELGLLKLEAEGDLTLFGCKDYIFNGKAKIKGVSKSAKPLPASPEGYLRFAVTQWGGFSDRLRTKDFSNYYNRVIIKEIRREYNKGIVQGNQVIPFELKNETVDLNNKKPKEIKYDYFKELIKIHGFIKIPQPGEYYFSDYQEIPKIPRIKYFRRGRGMPIDKWAQAAGLDVNQLLERMRYFEES